MDTSITIKKEPEAFRAAAYDGEKFVGKCTYVVGSDNVWTLDHTIVDPNYGGKGIAGALVAAVADMARAAKTKIIPQCSYAAAVFARKSEYGDVWEKKSEE